YKRQSGDRGLYRRFGCFKSGIVYYYNVPYDKLTVDEQKFNIVPYDESRIMDVISIYQREPVRYQRTFEEFKLLLENFMRMPQYRGLRSGIFLAEKSGKALAYAAFSSFDSDSMKIWEYAGSRNTILHLIARILETENISSLELAVPFHDVETLSLLEERGLSKSRIDSEASMLILNPSVFFEKVKRYLVERVGEEAVSKVKIEEFGEGVKVVLNGEAFMLELSDITLLFLDSPDAKRPREKITPIKRFLSGALPIPTPLYGLNYI
ncbi:MAG: hypothetical protein N3E47_07540, partial [Candidatus Bathyarchaeota archaeon]|nr:hypothetical protein [Candidatus Bathyarchaeota archaeon]